MECAGDELPEVLYFPGGVEDLCCGASLKPCCKNDLKYGLRNLMMLKFAEPVLRLIVDEF